MARALTLDRSVVEKIVTEGIGKVEPRVDKTDSAERINDVFANVNRRLSGLPIDVRVRDLPQLLEIPMLADISKLARFEERSAGVFAQVWEQLWIRLEAAIAQDPEIESSRVGSIKNWLSESNAMRYIAFFDAVASRYCAEQESVPDTLVKSLYLMVKTFEQEQAELIAAQFGVKNLMTTLNNYDFIGLVKDSATSFRFQSDFLPEDIVDVFYEAVLEPWFKELEENPDSIPDNRQQIGFMLSSAQAPSLAVDYTVISESLLAEPILMAEEKEDLTELEIQQFDTILRDLKAAGVKKPQALKRALESFSANHTGGVALVPEALVEPLVEEVFFQPVVERDQASSAVSVVPRQRIKYLERGFTYVEKALEEQRALMNQLDLALESQEWMDFSAQASQLPTAKKQGFEALVPLRGKMNTWKGIKAFIKAYAPLANAAPLPGADLMQAFDSLGVEGGENEIAKEAAAVLRSSPGEIKKRLKSRFEAYKGSELKQFYTAALEWNGVFSDVKKLEVDVLSERLEELSTEFASLSADIQRFDEADLERLRGELAEVCEEGEVIREKIARLKSEQLSPLLAELEGLMTLENTINRELRNAILDQASQSDPEDPKSFARFYYESYGVDTDKIFEYTETMNDFMEKMQCFVTGLVKLMRDSKEPSDAEVQALLISIGVEIDESEDDLDKALYQWHIASVQTYVQAVKGFMMEVYPYKGFELMIGLKKNSEIKRLMNALLPTHSVKKFTKMSDQQAGFSITKS